MKNLNLIETRTGLPNTCSVCGSEPGETWFAENEDRARSGLGRCRNCMQAPEDPQPQQEGREIAVQKRETDEQGQQDQGTPVQQDDPAAQQPEADKLEGKAKRG